MPSFGFALGAAHGGDWFPGCLLGAGLVDAGLCCFGGFEVAAGGFDVGAPGVLDGPFAVFGDGPVVAGAVLGRHLSVVERLDGGGFRLGLHLGHRLGLG